ncbi:peptidyl-prolyl cis-trans isomerase C [Vreelandella subglaciescola]|jgi:peptidyl-prolyl cis-trans isomerase C|uniref:peptidylprolyl isomerase n=1 Tax=Vreelandella subglaciescola TaxID=29571 RepID=A0A1M7EE90_9GAMM|nr:peptidyl-prolyl cis-trans isomerase C [Halomonas subglaciescola]
MSIQMIDIEELPGKQTPPPVVVGNREINEADIAAEMQYHPADSAGSAQLKAARALVVRELLHQRAQQIGLTPADSDADNDAIAELLEQELAVPEPGKDDCERFYAIHPERFSQPEQLSVRHILLSAPPDDAKARDAQYHLGVDLLEQLSAHPERMTELAQRYSACPSKDAGGELGWLLPGQTVAELDRALKHLPEGLHERPLASRYGWHLVWVDAREESRQLPYEAVAEQVRLSLLEQATRRGLRHYLLALESEIGVAGVTLDEDSGGSLMR